MNVERTHSAPNRHVLDSRRAAWWSGATSTSLLVLATGALILLPVFWLFQSSLADGARGFRRVIDSGGLPGLLRTTFTLALGSVVVALVLGTALAWFAHRLPAGRRWMSVLPIAPLFVPGIVLAAGWTFLLSPRIGYLNVVLRKLPLIDGTDGPFDIYTSLWIVLLAGFAATGFVYLFLRSSLAQLNQEVIDAAAVSGASPTRVFFVVVLPLLRPGLVYGAATTFLLCVGQVTFPLILGRQRGIDVLSTGMYRYANDAPRDYGAAATLGMPILLLGLLVLIVQRFVVGDQAKYAMVGHGATRPMRTTGPLGQVCLILFGLVALVLPVTAIAYVSLSPFWTSSMSLDGLSFAAYSEVFDNDRFVSGIKNSIQFSLLAVVVTLPISYLSARVIFERRQRRGLAIAQETLVSLPIGIPAIIFGVGFLVAYTSEPLMSLNLYGSTWSMVLVYIVLVMPFAVRMQLAAMTGIGRNLADAASVCGAGWFRRTLAVELPLLRPALGSAIALMVALLAQEFSASLLVRAGNTQVMATALYDALSAGSYPVASAIALMMFGITTIGVAIAFVLGGRSAIERLGGS